MDFATNSPAVDQLLGRLGALDGLVVAFSGGADSAFLLAAAVRAMGADQVVAATAVSDSLATWEREPAGQFAAQLGVRHLWPQTNEMAREGYRANAGNRCYFCKAELLEVLTPLADEWGWPVATGTNADDAVAGFRPGIAAAAERGALTPLLDAGLTKQQVRLTSQLWGLPTWDKPAAACLSSRIAYGITITPAGLARVDRAEAGVRRAWASATPLTDLRVRDLGEGRARLEVDQAALAVITSSPVVAAQVAAAVTDAGFSSVQPRLFRSGSMNDALTAH